MSSIKSKTKDWRQFELLISKLERLLKPSNCQFRSPDWLFDKEINDKREVDCSIVFPDGRVLSIECRKRGSKQDVTWIEQLVAKKAALGVTETIAVSSQGFSKASYLKASKHNITLNTYREFDVEKVADAFSHGLLINQIQRKWAVHEVQFETTDGSPEVSEAELAAFQQNLATNVGKAVVLIVPEKSESVTLSQLMELCLEDHSKFVEGVNHKTFKIGFQAGKITIPGLQPTVFLASLTIKADIFVTKKMLNELKMGRYASEAGTLLQVARGSYESGSGEKMNIELVYRSGDKEELRTL